MKARAAAPESTSSAPGRARDAQADARAYLDRSAGRPLDASTRREFESSFDADLGRVRIHDDPEAAWHADALRAQAYAHGPHIGFNRARHAPQSVPGRQLLAHELAHVLQQEPGMHRAAIRAPAAADAEAEADIAGARAAAGAPATVGVAAGGGGVQCKPLSADEIAALDRSEFVEQRMLEAEEELKQAQSEDERRSLDEEHRRLAARLAELKSGKADAGPPGRPSSAPAPMALNNEITPGNAVLLPDGVLRRELAACRTWIVAHPRLSEQASPSAAFERVARALDALEREQLRREQLAQALTAAEAERRRRLEAERAAREQAEIARRKEQWQKDYEKSQRTPGFWSLFDRTIYRDPTRDIQDPLLRFHSETTKEGARSGAALAGGVTAVLSAVAAGVVVLAVGGLALSATASLLAEAGVVAGASAQASALYARGYVCVVQLMLEQPQLVEFAAGKVFQIAVGGGIMAYLQRLGTPEGALELLHDFVFVLGNLPTRGSGSGGGGGEPPPTTTTVRGRVIGRSGQQVTVEIEPTAAQPAAVPRRAPVAPDAGNEPPVAAQPRPPQQPPGGSAGPAPRRAPVQAGAGTDHPDDAPIPIGQGSKVIGPPAKLKGEAGTRELGSLAAMRARKAAAAAPQGGSGAAAEPPGATVTSIQRGAKVVGKPAQLQGGPGEREVGSLAAMRARKAPPPPQAAADEARQAVPVPRARAVGDDEQLDDVVHQPGADAGDRVVGAGDRRRGATGGTRGGGATVVPIKRAAPPRGAAPARAVAAPVRGKPSGPLPPRGGSAAADAGGGEGDAAPGAASRAGPAPGFGTPEPTLRNATWGDPPITGNKQADKFEQSQRRGGGSRSLYVWTGRGTAVGSPEHVEFDDYRPATRTLVDAKARVGKAGSIYDVREPRATAAKPGFRQQIILKKVWKQEEARQRSGANDVVWVVQDPVIADALRAFFEAAGFSTFSVEGPTSRGRGKGQP